MPAFKRQHLHITEYTYPTLRDLWRWVFYWQNRIKGAVLVYSRQSNRPIQTAAFAASLAALAAALASSAEIFSSILASVVSALTKALCAESTFLTAAKRNFRAATRGFLPLVFLADYLVAADFLAAFSAEGLMGLSENHMRM